MKLKTYMLNEGRSKSISVEYAKSLLFNQCSDAFKVWKKNNEEYIFRGVNSYDNYMKIDSKKFSERISANTTNEYTLLINNILKSWEKYPKRNVICSTSMSNAKSYGNLYHLFPVNGAKLGICNRLDVWTSFKMLGERPLYRVNDFINEINNDNNNLAMFVHNTYKKDVNPSIIRTYRFMMDWKDNETLYDYFNYILSPANNDFKLVKVGQQLPKDREVWFDDKALLIRYYNKEFIEDEI